MWVVFGTKRAVKHVPNGACVERVCGSCGAQTTFVEMEQTSTLRLYFTDVFDYARTRVMQCSACNAQYATDEVGQADPTLGGDLGRTIDRGAAAIGRVADNLGKEVSGVASRLAGAALGRPRAAEPVSSSSATSKPALSEDDLAALSERSGGPARRVEADAPAPASTTSAQRLRLKL